MRFNLALFALAAVGCFTFCPHFANAQASPNLLQNWFFGYQAGLSFSAGAPVFQAGSAMLAYGSVAVANNLATGSLQFYSNGQQVWNANNAVMANGSGLQGDVYSSQAALAVPKPGSATNWFLFTAGPGGGSAGLKYNEIDMSLNGGLGDVIAGQKNLALLSPAADVMAAVKHCNGTDYWLIGHKWNTGEFYAWQVSATGVSGTPVITNVGPTVPTSASTLAGVLKASPNGRMLVLTQNHPTTSSVTRFDFDPQTGIVSSPITLQQFGGEYGATFSPDNSKLYTTRSISIQSGVFQQSEVHQYDLFQPLLPPVLLGSLVDSTKAMAGMQLGPDGKAYIAVRFLDSVYALNAPNASGGAAGFQINAVQLLNSTNRQGLVNFVESASNQPLKPNFTYNTACTGSVVRFRDSTLAWAPNAYTLTWDFGDPGSTNNMITGPGGLAGIVTHIFNAAGSYSVKYILQDACGYKDSVTKVIQILNQLPVNLGADSLFLCLGQTQTLSTGIANPDSIRWSTGATTPTLSVGNVSGWVKVIVYSGNCDGTDSVYVSVNSTPTVVSLGSNATLCGNATYPLVATNAPAGSTYVWSPNATQVNGNKALAPGSGTYYVTVTYAGCTASDTVLVTLVPVPSVFISGDSVTCDGVPITLNANPSNTAVTYAWNTGSTSQSTVVDSPGTYSVRIETANGCASTDSFTVREKCFSTVYAPTAFTPDADGHNEDFVVYVRFVEKGVLSVYDRFGRLVAEAQQNDFTAVWDGTSNGKAVQAGTYAWHFSFTNQDGEAQKVSGLVQVIR